MVTALHIRHNGESHDFDYQVPENATDQDLISAAELIMDLPSKALEDYQVVRTSQAIIIRPEAIYG